jgi:hypothetical protein
MYLVLERKPDNGGKIQNLTDVALGIMLCLKALKSTTKEKAIAAATATATGANNSDDIADEGRKGTQVLLELMEPRHHSICLVTADLYFVSVEVALKLKENNLFYWQCQAVQ